MYKTTKIVLELKPFTRISQQDPTIGSNDSIPKEKNIFSQKRAQNDHKTRPKLKERLDKNFEHMNYSHFLIYT